MLFTRCPGCQTTFRITADTLRVANGAVRCGSCATVFSAFSGLQQDGLEGELKADEDFLSPTMQTQELAGIEELAGPDLEAAPTAEPQDEPAVAATDLPIEQAEQAPSDPDLQTDAEISESPVPIVETQADVEPESAQDDEASDSRLEPEEAPASEALTPEQRPGAVVDESSGESSDDLEFDVPTDDWALLLSEIEQSAEAEGGAEDEAGRADPDAFDDAAEPEAEERAVGFWDVGDPAAAESWTEIEESAEENVGNQHVAVGDLEAAPELETPVADAQTEVAVSELLDAETDISAEQVDATLSTDPDPDIVEALEAGLSSPLAGARRSSLWTVGSAALVLVLAVQVVHHFRAPLAGNSLIGPLVRGSYGFLGMELAPEWDLDQYEILNWVATEAGVGNLRITAQIRNNGPRAQPYPYVHLELKDRWEAVVGSRVFEPGEYLEPDADVGTPMVAGVTVPADFAVVDPGEDAYGFELDVCLRRGAGELSCASQRVFE